MCIANVVPESRNTIRESIIGILRNEREKDVADHSHHFAFGVWLGGYRLGPGIGYYGGRGISLILLILIILLLLKVI
jgi:hypothetical protein